MNKYEEECVSNCYQCGKTIIEEDDPAKVCIECGGLNRRLPKNKYPPVLLGLYLLLTGKEDINPPEDV